MQGVDEEHPSTCSSKTSGHISRGFALGGLEPYCHFSGIITNTVINRICAIEGKPPPNVFKNHEEALRAMK